MTRPLSGTGGRSDWLIVMVAEAELFHVKASVRGSVSCDVANRAGSR